MNAQYFLENGFRVNFREDFYGQSAYLVVGGPQTKWMPENLKYRSAILDKNGEVLSMSHKKFFNYQEKPELYPDPLNHKDWIVTEKCDGSTVVVDSINGHINFRTRGTFDMADFPTRGEVVDFLAEHSEFTNWLHYNPYYSFVFEHYSPNNRIVLNYGDKPEFWLTAVLAKHEARLFSRESLVQWSNNFRFDLPKVYATKDLNSLAEEVKELKDFEGFCLYYNNWQNIIKLKSDDYLFKHRAKSQLCNYNRVVDYWYDYSKQSEMVFRRELEKTFDWETMESINVYIDRLFRKIDEVLHEFGKYIEIAKSLKGLTRAQQAREIQQNHKKEIWSLLFAALDGKLKVEPKMLYD